VAPNSAEAIRRAVQLGSPGIELDAHRLADGLLVAAHDDHLQVEGRQRALIDLSWPELRAADVALTALEELINELAGYPGLLVFDWKGYGCEAQLAQLLRRAGLFERTLVTSIYPAVLARLQGEVPGIALGLSFPARVYGRLDDRAQMAATLLDDAGAGTAALDRRLPDLRLIAERVRAHGAGLFLWTAPDLTTFAELAALRPDGIMTDDVEAQLRSR
jgi:glycerophosphoryl diester phosphodiesterase